MSENLTFKTPDKTGFVPDLSLKGKLFVHFKGGVYHLRGYKWDATNDLWVVDYFSLNQPVSFTRTAAEFFGKNLNGADRFRQIKGDELPNPWEGHSLPPPHYPPGVRHAGLSPDDVAAAVSHTKVMRNG